MKEIFVVVVEGRRAAAGVLSRAVEGRVGRSRLGVGLELGSAVGMGVDDTTALDALSCLNCRGGVRATVMTRVSGMRFRLYVGTRVAGSSVTLVRGMRLSRPVARERSS